MTLGKEKRVKDIMTRDVVTVRGDETVEECAYLMSRHGFSGLPVVDKFDKIEGIVTEGDLIRRASKLKGPSYINILSGTFYLDSAKDLMREVEKSRGNLAREVMTKEVYTIDGDKTIEDAANIIIDRDIKRLPVVDRSGKLIGIVSRMDIIHSLFYKK